MTEWDTQPDSLLKHPRRGTVITGAFSVRVVVPGPMTTHMPEGILKQS